MRSAKSSAKQRTSAGMPRAASPALRRPRAREGENACPNGMKTRTTGLVVVPSRLPATPVVPGEARPAVRPEALDLLSGRHLLFLRRRLARLLGSLLGGL